MMLKGKVAVVTGGSRGIGYATVEAFLKEGAAVVLCASREETACGAVTKLKETYPEAVVEGIWPKLSDYGEVEKAFAQTAAKYGSLDILVNNAGMSDSTPFLDYTEETFEKVMDLNVKSVYNCSRAACAKSPPCPQTGLSERAGDPFPHGSWYRRRRPWPDTWTT